MIEFLAKNWVNLLLVVVGLSALLIYGLQERRKKIDAASLIIIQIDDLIVRLQELRSYIVDGQLNWTAFYESLPLMDVDYWNRYKHLFVRKMDSNSFGTINRFYDYVSEIQEQQTLLKKLQKNSFFSTQSAITFIETYFLLANFNNGAVPIEQVATSLINAMPQNIVGDDRAVLEQFIRSIPSNNILNSEQLASLAQQKQKTINAINRSGFTVYIPEQIRISLEKEFEKYSLMTVVGSEGYKLLKETSEHRF